MLCVWKQIMENPPKAKIVRVLTWRWDKQLKGADELDHTHSPEKKVRTDLILWMECVELTTSSKGSGYYSEFQTLLAEKLLWIDWLKLVTAQSVETCRHRSGNLWRVKVRSVQLHFHVFWLHGILSKHILFFCLLKKKHSTFGHMVVRYHFIAGKKTRTTGLREVWVPFLLGLWMDFGISCKSLEGWHDLYSLLPRSRKLRFQKCESLTKWTLCDI